MKRRCKRRHWTPLESARLRRDYGRVPVEKIAASLGRTTGSVYQRAAKLRLNKSSRIDWTCLDAEIRLLHAGGWTDAEICATLGRIAGRHVGREAVGARRRVLGLPHNGFSEHRRRTVAAKTKEQLDRAGVATLAELRCQAWGDAARRCGWPRDLRPRAVQILNTLFQRGPMTRRQISDAVGMPWKGSRRSLVSNDREGTYLWNLVHRGLVVRLPRLVKGVGKGRSLHLYALALGVAPHFEQEVS